MILLNLISKKIKISSEVLLLLYFLGMIFYIKSSPFYIIILLFPPSLILLLFIFLKKREEKNLFFQLCSLILPLESSMKSGLSFLNAWQKSLKEIKSKKIKNKLQIFTQIFPISKRILLPRR